VTRLFEGLNNQIHKVKKEQFAVFRILISRKHSHL